MKDFQTVKFADTGRQRWVSASSVFSSWETLCAWSPISFRSIVSFLTKRKIRSMYIYIVSNSPVGVPAVVMIPRLLADDRPNDLFTGPREIQLGEHGGIAAVDSEIFDRPLSEVYVTLRYAQAVLKFRERLPEIRLGSIEPLPA